LLRHCPPERLTIRGLRVWEDDYGALLSILKQGKGIRKFSKLHAAWSPSREFWVERGILEQTNGDAKQEMGVAYLFTKQFIDHPPDVVLLSNKRTEKLLAAFERRASGLWRATVATSDRRGGIMFAA